MKGQVISHYKLVDIIGKGTFSVVYKAIDMNKSPNQKNHIVAIKAIEKSQIDQEKQKREATISLQLQHPNIANFFEVIDDENYVYFVMEFFQDGTFLDYLKKLGHGLDERKACFFFKQMAEAVGYLHSKNIIHRDIKFENFVVVNKKNSSSKSAGGPNLNKRNNKTGSDFQGLNGRIKRDLNNQNDKSHHNNIYTNPFCQTQNNNVNNMTNNNSNHQEDQNNQHHYYNNPFFNKSVNNSNSNNNKDDDSNYNFKKMERKSKRLISSSNNVGVNLNNDENITSSSGNINHCMSSDHTSLSSRGEINTDENQNQLDESEDDILIKLIDFGFSIKSENSDNPSNPLKNTFCGSLSYSAPEIITNTAYTDSIDIWSLGVVLFGMIFGTFPFQGAGEVLMNEILTSQPVFPKHVSNELQNLIIGMLKKKPHQRLNIDQILQHRWIAENTSTMANPFLDEVITIHSTNKLLNYIKPRPDNHRSNDKAGMKPKLLRENLVDKSLTAQTINLSLNKNVSPPKKIDGQRSMGTNLILKEPVLPSHSYDYRNNPKLKYRASILPKTFA
ncbi:hypothetical protein TRFO_20003 [Tritrichomonas foetus]|uniref:Protein kinase domain-containing protein n=1 Tax=Tritrichomonas foetus TaxID=1144522 RepID=A0A1J4KHT5_9EUKA|nr:hypothetical protein TRFO_20003 [Tritrichomonas foetus]|eukprot:OHT10602.1 hypothetical protein TRFO_20003 [Tritrichomonas foetus]